jgi:hypothetical protein
VLDEKLKCIDREMKKEPFIILLTFLSVVLNGQPSCNVSTVAPSNIYYSGPAGSYTMATNSATLYLCDNATLYDSTVTGDRITMINAGAKYYWRPCGAGPSEIYIKNGGTLIVKNSSCLTSKNIISEAGAIIMDPYGVLSSFTSTYSCASITFSLVNCAVGISEPHFSGHKVRLYPNPGSGILNIDVENADFENGQIEITNALGQIAFNLPYSRSIDISELEKGFYTVKTIGPNHQALSKFIKE